MGCDQTVCNGGRELRGGAVAIAYRNAQHMTRQGYQWEVCPALAPDCGTVINPFNRRYSVWLPGTLSLYPEGKCTCPYFCLEIICKHLYFAVQESGKESPAPPTWEDWDASENQDEWDLWDAGQVRQLDLDL